MGKNIAKIIALAAVLSAGAVTSAAAAPAQEHTFSGTVTVPVSVPAGSLPTFSVEFDEHTIDSQHVAGGGGILTLAFAGSATEPAWKTHKCPGHGQGTRLRLTGLSAGTFVTATYTPTGGAPLASPTLVVPPETERVDGSLCTGKR